ncbi:MAG: diacylglycerol kinase family protein [Patescibacteria group bacterium]
MPYFYLYDTYANDRTHANTLVRIENTLTDLGIQGKVGRLTILKSAKDLIDFAIKDGADTIVAVGNDLTISKVAAALIGRKQEVTMGIIPVGEKNQSMANLLGIPIGVLACHVLSSRIIELLDLGKVNSQYFIRSVLVSGTPIITCDDQFSLALNRPHTIKICNLDSWKLNGQTKVANPKNKMLETVLTPIPQKGFLGFHKKKQASGSQLIMESCKIASPGNSLPVVVDGERVLKTPVTIKIASQRIKVIVGKKRLI